ncbi:DNA mismatch repair protein MutT, partial [Xanthomonas arboricola]
ALDALPSPLTTSTLQALQHLPTAASAPAA